MKNPILTLLILFTSTCFAQNRKTLLKEINSYKNKIIQESTFSVAKDSLKTILNLYLKSDGFIFHSKTDSNNVYYKTLSCFGENQFIDKKPNKYNKPISRNFFITTSFEAQNKPFYPKIQSYLSNSYVDKYQYNQAVLSNGTQSLPINTNRQTCYYKKSIFNFNKKNIRRFLYIYFYGNQIPFSPELIAKIKSYNSQQTKEKKQLIVGRDF